MKNPHSALDKSLHAPRMRAPMHSNYRKTFAREGAAALSQGSIRQNRTCVPARADALETNDSMR
jgi:hypothetical protein